MSDDTARQVIEGLVYTHNRANANTARLHETATTLRAVVDLLVEAGVVDPDRLKAECDVAAESVRREFVERGMAVAIQEFPQSKYDFDGGVEIDCDERLALCHGACCKLNFALSTEDVREGIVRWDLGRPYMILHDQEGYCSHHVAGQGCGVYANRPTPCRGYDCRSDDRVWLDFEARVVNPRIDDPDWPDCLNRPPTEPGQPA